MNSHHRKSIRLKGFDYSLAAVYFVTICTKDRERILSDIVDGEPRMSKTGKIVGTCWREIPNHFENTIAGICQVMPNHIHGIIEIKPRLNCDGGTRHAVSLQDFTGEVFGKPRPGSLSTIIGSFKSAATNRVHKHGIHHGKSIWQPRFHDRIIRTDIEHYFIERYIELNPLLWHADLDNPCAHKPSIDDLRRMLRDRHGLDDYAIDCIVECEIDYRQWTLPDRPK